MFTKTFRSIQQLDVQRVKILIQILNVSNCVSACYLFSLVLLFRTLILLPRPRDGDDVLSLREEPSERNLSRRGIVLRSYLLDFLHDLEALGKFSFEYRGMLRLRSRNHVIVFAISNPIIVSLVHNLEL